MNDDLIECEICGEMFPPEEITRTFYWTVCDKCKEEHEDYYDNQHGN